MHKLIPNFRNILVVNAVKPKKKSSSVLQAVYIRLLSEIFGYCSSPSFYEPHMRCVVSIHIVH
jgi:hypothetical protein